MTSRLADFEVRAELGSGGSAVVYDAELDGQRVALKVLREELALSAREKQRFVDEAKRLVAVDHPGLVKLVRAGVLPDGRPFIAMPFVEGRTLADLLAEGALAPPAAVRVFGVLARAVGALHDAGMVHRDIKPENILIVDEADGPRPVLLDLGIARDVDAAASTTTSAGRIRGTPAYMAPERFFGAAASPRSDIYELGVTLYMMLVGRLPWGSAESVEDRLAPRGPDAYEPRVGAALARATLSALSTRPDARPATAVGMAEEIERAFGVDGSAIAPRTTEDLAPSVPPPGFVEAAAARETEELAARTATTMHPAAARRGARSLYAIVAVVGLVAAVVFALTRSPESAAAPAPARAQPSTPAAARPMVTAMPSSTEPRPTRPAPSAVPSAPAAASPGAAHAGRAGSVPHRAKSAEPVKPAPTADPFLEDRR